MVFPAREKFIMPGGIVSLRMTSEEKTRLLCGFYSSLEADVDVRYHFDPTDGHTFQQFNNHLLNFREAMKLPIHNWYEYKEGFSPALILKLLRELGVNREGLVLDPFCGGGTLPLTCFYENIPSVGFEANPFSQFLARVKTRKYERADIRLARDMLPRVLDTSGEPPEFETEFSMIDRVFERGILESLLKIRENITDICSKTHRLRDFFKLGWLAVLEGLSNYRKAGNGLKKKVRSKRAGMFERGRDPAVNAFSEKIGAMISDLEDFALPNSPKIPPPRVIGDSCQKVDEYLDDNSVSGTIFSPPYLNCFDYSEIYKVELWFGEFVARYSDLKVLRSKSLISHMNNQRLRNHPVPRAVSPEVESLIELVAVEDLWDRRIPDMIRGYFSDMEDFLARLYPLQRKGSPVAIVVSNSAYGGVVFPTDVLLGKIGEAVGFHLTGIESVRPIVTSSQQFKDLLRSGFNKFMRESIVYLEAR
ncbi:MAG: hypothetical protein ACTSU5_00875 [Promethearchaeota archaeon]